MSDITAKKNGLYKLSPVHQNVHQTCTFGALLVFCCSSVNLISLYFAVINALVTSTYNRETRTENPCVGGSSPPLPITSEPCANRSQIVPMTA